MSGVTTYDVSPIGWVTSSRSEAIDDDWDSVSATITLDADRLGVTVCRLLEVDDLTLRVEALDAIDGTPVLDLKPVMAEFLPRGEIHQPDWSRELMATYWSRS